MEMFMSILKLNSGSFLLQVGFPFIVAIGALFAVYAGYLNLINQIDTQSDLDDKTEKINQAFIAIEEQEEVLIGQKNELETQQKITGNLNLEYTKQKEFNQLLKQIQILSLGAKNGSRKDFEDFYSLGEGDKLNSELYDIWEKEYSYLRNLWVGELEKINFFRLTHNTNTGEKIRYSQEYLYGGLSNLWANNIRKYNDKDYAAYFKEIELSKSKSFIEVLYTIATEGRNISYSILAAKTLCAITNFEPYPSSQFADSYRQLFTDIPRFKNMKEWWVKSGSQNVKYKCPFDKIVESDRNYYYYHRSNSDKSERLELLIEAIRNCPNLSRTKAEIAYLKLGKPSTYGEVERLAQEAILGADMEPLPYLLLSFVGLKQNDNDKIEKNLKLAKLSLNQKSMITTIRLNSKLHELLVVAEELNILD